MGKKASAKVPQEAVEETKAPPAQRRKSTARKCSSFEALEQRPPETTSVGEGCNCAYQLFISNIAAFDLEDTGSRFDEQDPLVTLKVGSAKTETERQEDAGVNANFPENFVFDLTKEDVDEELCVEVLNKSIIGVRKHVGKGQILLRDALPKCNKDTTVTIELTHKSKKGEKLQGKLTMRAKLVDMTPKQDACCSMS